MSDALSPDVVALLGLLVRSTLLVIVATIAAAILRGLGAAAASRHWVWLLAIGAIAVLPLLTAALPPIVIAIPHSFALFAGADLSAPGEHVPPTRPADIVLWSLFTLGVAVLLSRLVAARLTLSRLWRRARPGDAYADLPELAQHVGITHPVLLRFADAPIAPMTWGRRILLPAEASHWPSARQRDVLLHELSHMARRDSLTQVLAAIVRAFFWFSPAVWYALRQLRIEQEHACDECVLAAGAQPDAYAQTLIDVAAGRRAPALGMGVSAAMAQHSDLERRVRAIVTPARRTSLTLVHIAALGAAALASIAFIATAQPIDSARILSPLAPLSPMASVLPRLAR